MLPVSLDHPTFGQLHFGSARLGNRARTRRLVHVADRLLAHPGGTPPEVFADPKQLKAFYRLLRPRAVTHAAVLQPHRQLTRARMAQAQGPVLLLHDTTELDYSGLRSLSLQDLPRIGNGTTRGFLAHHALAVQAHGRRVLGLANQILYRRPAVPPRETRAQRRQRADRESRLWQRGCVAVGPAPAGVTVIDVCDRGADVFEFLDFACAHGRQFLVRAAQDRCVTVEDRAALEALHVQAGPGPGRLFDYARALPEWDRQVLDVPARERQPARRVAVRLAAGPVQLQPPQAAGGRHRGQALPLWVVYVGERQPPPPGVEAREWMLLTNVPVATVADLWERLDWYECRPLVEELHKSQKTGCAIEKLQLGKRNHDGPRFDGGKNRLEPAIALYSVVAVQLLQLREESRAQAPAAAPATTLFRPEEVAVLSGWRYGEPQRVLSVREFCLALARLGGHQNRKGDGLPGWQTLWRGWCRLQTMVEGAKAAGAWSPESTPPASLPP
jgi:hypothetical protein